MSTTPSQASRSGSSSRLRLRHRTRRSSRLAWLPALLPLAGCLFFQSLQIEVPDDDDDGLFSIEACRPTRFAPGAPIRFNQPGQRERFSCVIEGAERIEWLLGSLNEAVLVAVDTPTLELSRAGLDPPLVGYRDVDLRLVAVSGGRRAEERWLLRVEALPEELP